MAPAAHPFEKVVKELTVSGATHRYFSLPALSDPRVARLPHSIRVLLESAVRNCDGFAVTEADVAAILDWEKLAPQGVEVQYKPARVMLQDFTGVPAVVDLAAMREATKALGGDPERINPLVNVHAVVDHSLQVDVSASPEAAEENARIEFERNHERFRFLKWGQGSFRNMTVTPPSNAIVHQLNLEYACRSVCRDDKTGTVYLDSTVGTDSHTTMSAGLGVLSWGVGGLEAEAVMLGQAISLVLPEVIGYRLTGDLPTGSTATDLVLTVVNELRKVGVVGKFVEFFGPGVAALSLADRATISNMSPETGATTVFFPPDAVSMAYLRQTGRPEEHVQLVEAYLKEQGLFRDYAGEDPVFTRVMELDLASIRPCVSGPKRPHDRVALDEMKADFAKTLTARVGFKGFGLPEDAVGKSVDVELAKGGSATLRHGSVVIAAITSCTNTSNPDVMLAAGLLAKRAVEKGLAGAISPACKTSMAPGSRVVIEYLNAAGLMPSLEALGFHVVGVGCAVCIGNSGPLADPKVEEAIEANDLVVAGVLSGNRNFEGRVSPYTRANFLASPPLVVAYALAGRVDIDFETEPIANSSIDGKPVFLRDIWPGRDECARLTNEVVKPALFKKVYANLANGNERWNKLDVAAGSLYAWDPKSTYIHLPNYFEGMTRQPVPASNGSRAIRGARALLNLGDSITTDHISPAGAIARSSPAARYLAGRGVEPKDFNSYGSRRGNDEVMVRGTYANIRIVNKLVAKAGPRTVHVPSGEEGDIFDVAMKYKEAGTPVICLAGKDLGSGSSRDWAAKGPMLQGVRACIATSYERIHRSNLVGMAIIPLQFEAGQDADSLGLTGKEVFDIELPDELVPGQDVKVSTDTGVTFTTKLRIDTPSEKAFVEHGGILQYVIRSILDAEDEEKKQ